MTTATRQEVQARLPAILAEMKPGEELLITDNEQPVARLVRTPRERKLGSAVGKLVILQEDDEHLEDFKEYM